MDHQPEKETLDEREVILQAAEKIVVEQGSPGITAQALLEETGLPPDLFIPAFEDLDDVATLALQRVLLSYGDRAEQRENLYERLEHFVVLAMEVLIRNGLYAVRHWIRESVKNETTHGFRAVLTFWDIVSRFFELAVEEGILKDETPVGRMVNLLTGEFFGTLLCWCIMDGQGIEPVHTVSNYCLKELPIVLKEYLNH